MTQQKISTTTNGAGTDERSKLLQLSGVDGGTNGGSIPSGLPPPPPPPKPPSSLPSSDSKASQQPPPPSASSHFGSLDYEQVVNEYSMQAKRDLYLSDDGLKRIQKSRNLDSRSITRWALTIGCSVLSGLTSVVVVSTCEKIVQWRTNTLDRLLLSHVSVGTVFVWYAFVSLVLADTAAVLCVYWVPEAAGSGIPEVKASLNGIRVNKFDYISLLVVKMVGSVLSVASSLAVGMEGPLVSIGAIVGACLAHVGSHLSSILLRCCSGYRSPFLTRLWIWAISDLSYFANDAERRNLITVGAACGFAASFGSPIGGLLFALEDLSSFFGRAMFLRVLVANALGTFCLALYRRDLTSYGSIQFGTYNIQNGNIFVHRVLEIPFWIMVGIGGGILGGLFGVALARLKQWSGKHFQSGRQHMLRISYVSLGTSVIMFFLPTMKWLCHDVVASDGSDNPTSLGNATNGLENLDSSTAEEAEEFTYERRYFCEDGQINGMAAMMFGSRNHAIVKILSNPGQFHAATLFIVGMVFYVLMCITNTTQIPCGTFTPTVLAGASFGGAIGILLEKYVDENISPSTFALLGVAALMAGIQRSTVSVCVILVEGTGQIRVLLPVMVVVVVANYVAHMINKDGIYEILIKLKGYPYLEHSDYKDSYDLFEVQEIMNQSFITLRERETVSKLVSILKKSRNEGFPVVDNKGKFKGLVRRKQIVALIECGVFEKPQIDDESIDESSTSASPQSVWSPKPGVGFQPLMHWAFHIKDDRYNEKLPSVNDVEGDDLDDNGDLFNVQNALNNVNQGPMTPTVTTGSNRSKRKTYTGPTDFTGSKQGGKNHRMSFLDSKSLRQLDSFERKFVLDGDETMPMINPSILVSTRSMDGIIDEKELVVRSSTGHHYVPSDSSLSANPSFDAMDPFQNVPTGFARVGRRLDGTLLVAWVNPSHRHDIVNLQAVMNRGTFAVPKSFPLSKAYKLFTELGLRWIVVVGEGGQVVGIVDRGSLLASNVKEKTGIDTSDFS